MEGSSGTPDSIRDGAGHSYPGDLARFVRERWNEAAPGGEDAGAASALLPDAQILEELLSTCYQASLLREEERPVSFRSILAYPALFDSGEGPPDGLHKLEFSRPRSLDPRELRRLSVAADSQRTLIGARLLRDPEEGTSRLQVWGVVHSGLRWLREVRGGRRAGAPLPPAPVVHVEAPGNLAVRRGNELVARLEGGRLSGSRADLFDSEWLPGEFSRLLEDLTGLHAAARDRARQRPGERWAPLAPGLVRGVAERMLKRVVSVVRESRHGGTVLFVPYERRRELSGANPYIDIEYPFAAGEHRHRFRDLIVGILNRLSRIHGVPERHPEPEPVGWREFETTTDGKIVALDEALFEVAYLIAGLAAADSAVVMSKHHELLGFGGEISGSIPAVRTVDRALDLEGEEVVEESVGEVGTRHRSAYRLLHALPEALAVVVSQDGGVRFVTSRNGRVTYWEQE